MSADRRHTRAVDRLGIHAGGEDVANQLLVVLGRGRPSGFLGDLLLQALRSGSPGIYTLQAAIAAVHAEAPRAEDTDWAEITGLYDVLLRINPSPIVELNRAVALAMRDGPEAGLQAIDRLGNHQGLQHYHLLHAARADLLRRLDRTQDAISCYQQALDSAQQEPEKRFLQQRLASLQEKISGPVETAAWPTTNE